VKKRPPGLVAIVLYKLFVGSLLSVTAVALLLALKNYPELQEFAESYQLESKHRLIDWVLDKILNLSPRTLEFSGIGAGLYAAVTFVEAVGLWHEKIWAEILVVVLVATSIPLEIYELIQGFSLIKIIVLGVNIAILIYLIKMVRNKLS
jgi:uncharacterized membrane protein (DUF2068 family)